MKLLLLSLALLIGAAHGKRLVFENRSGSTIWVGSLGNPGKALIKDGGWALGAGSKTTVDVADDWAGRVWGRTGCRFDSNGSGRCETGDCGKGLRCGGNGGEPPASLAEFTFNGHGGQDFYDVSLVDGFNIPVTVTGAGHGIGRELSLKFARLGAELICVDLHPENNQETVHQIREAGGVARGYVCDVSDRTAVHKMAQEVGRVDILINNAGIYPHKGLRNSTENEIKTLVDINLMSQLWTAQEFLPGMKERNHGHFVSISSVVALSGFIYMEPYAVSKAGLTGLVRSLQQEMWNERKDIKITIVYPFFVATRPEIKDLGDKNNVVPPLTVDATTNIIVQGIRQDLTSFTVPKSLGSALHLFHMMPETLKKKFFEFMFTGVCGIDYKLDAHEEILNKKL